MGDDAATPGGLWDKVRRIASEEVQKFARSGFLRNASISDGGLTIKGGFLRLRAPGAASDTFYAGGSTPNLPDGSPQPVMQMRRNDGTIALELYDPLPDVGGYNQFLAWRDRAGNIVFSDDTDSGEGIARPYLSGGFARTRFQDFGASTVSASFETLFDNRISKQQPRLEIAYRASADIAGTTGEVRIMINGVQFGATTTESFVVNTRFIGPLPVAGVHMSDLVIEVQARRTAGTGTIKVETIYWRGRQS